MRCGGNEKCITFLQSYNVRKDTPIQQKYNTPAAMLYRDRLLAEVEGRPLPTELPTVSSTASSKSTASSHLSNKNPAEMTEEEQREWIAEQQRLQEEARERLRQKFGSSSGLSSSGKMAGIGSDPNYRPGGASQPALNIPNLPIEVDLADVSKKTLDFFSSTWSALSEQVTKSTQQLLQEGEANRSAEPQTQDSSATASSNQFALPTWQPNTEEINEQLGKTWSMLSTGAANFWKQASEMTNDVLNGMVPNEASSMSSSTVSSSGGTNRTNDYFNEGNATAKVATPSPTAALPHSQSNSSMSSWDVLSDLGRDLPQDEVHDQAKPGRSTAPSPTPAPPAASLPKATPPLSASKQGSVKQKPAAAPQEDFFASFGV